MQLDRSFKGTPLYKVNQVAVMENFPTITKFPMHFVPVGKMWMVTRITVKTPSLGRVADIQFDSVPLGLVVDKNTYKEFNIHDFYAQPLCVTGSIAVLCNNEATVMAAHTFEVYGWQIDR